MYTLEECQDIVNKAIKNINLKKEPINLYLPIEYILSIGGKRLRPAMVLMACNMFSDDIDEAIDPALALEIFHNFTLLHDDIMDNSPIRRSQPTVHTKWNNNVAILSGDAMCILAYKYMLHLNPKIQSQVLAEFSQTAMEVCEGQQLDMDFEKLNNVGEQDYFGG